MMSSMHNSEKDLLSPATNRMNSFTSVETLTRVTLTCPESSDSRGKLVLLPDSLQELLLLGGKKFRITPAKVLSKEGAEIDDIDVIRDGDHLVLLSTEASRQS
ncbi:hypothetical protein MLD38_014999 [Melastoma candidum]|nr:hypothetical protein MLD38_014999 [Melastoma candidum]